MKRSIWVGFDPRESAAFAVARESIRSTLSEPVPIHGLVLSELRRRGLFWRETEIRGGVIWDAISEAPCSTEFSLSRFLVPHLANEGLAMFCDADVMARADVGELFDMAAGDPSKAAWCVKHDHKPSTALKMDGQIQTTYRRKNWSSVCIWNCDHPAIRTLTLREVNTRPGKWLHQFDFLADEEIGEIDPTWNHLVGERPENPQARLVHFTLGTPDMAGYETCEFSSEWRDALSKWAA